MSKQVNFWILYGTELYVNEDDWEAEELDVRTEEKFLAAFTSKEKAEAYAEASKAPTYKEDVYWHNQNKGAQFVSHSLLAGSTGYVVYPLDTPHLVIDPELSLESAIY